MAKTNWKKIDVSKEYGKGSIGYEHKKKEEFYAVVIKDPNMINHNTPGTIWTFMGGYPGEEIVTKDFKTKTPALKVLKAFIKKY